MSKNYCKAEWWLSEVKTRCEMKQKKSMQYKKSNCRFKILLLLSFIVLASAIAIGILADLHAASLIKSVGESLMTLLMFIAAILAGFTIDEYRNRSTILENASSLRPLTLMEIIEEMKNSLEPSQLKKCISHIQNGNSQMSKSGDEGFSALKAVIDNIIKEIC